VKRVVLLPAVIFSLLILFGCSSESKKATTTPNTSTADQENALADDALANGDYTTANTHYKAALAADPTNTRANLGAAVTEVDLVQNDPQVSSLVDQLQGVVPVPAARASRAGARMMGKLGLSNGRLYDPSSVGRMMAKLVLKATSDPPLLSEVQDAIKNKVLPKLQYAEDRLNVMESNPNFELLLPPAMTDGPDTIEVDLGDIRVLDAVVNQTQGWLGVVMAYNFDIPNPTELVPLDSLLGASTDFGKLNSDGAGWLTAARADLQQSHVEFSAGVAAINAETDNQDNDVIPQTALQEQGFLDFQSHFDDVDQSLNGPVDVTVKDYQNVDQTIQVQLKNFFTSPITDWKTKFPNHDFDPTTGDPRVLDPITFPDPTFNGIFPNLTNVGWQGLIGPVGPRPPGLRALRALRAFRR